MERILLGFLLSLAVFSSSAQSISGYVRDSLTGENLVGAYVYTDGNTSVAMTNEYGFFSLKISKQEVYPIKLNISYIGYKDLKYSIKEKAQAPIVFSLSPSMILQTVVVQSKVPQEDVMGLVEVPIKQIQTLPMLAGEVNIMRVMQLMPGVGAGSEGTSDLHVRGGTPDQNLILLDDVPIYYINHLGGFVSVFDANAISGFSFYKGSFPAKYGSRLSSVIDVRMKNGNMCERKTQIQAGILSSKITTEGPIKVDTSSYMISFRRSLFDVFSVPMSKLIDPGALLSYSFYDLHAKYNRILGPKDRLYVSFFNGYDKLNVKFKDKEYDYVSVNQEKVKWGNDLAAIRWNHAFNDQIFGNLTTYYTKYSYKQISKNYNWQRNFDSLNNAIINETTDNVDYINQIQDLSIKTDFDIYAKPIQIRLGTQHTYHSFKPEEVKIEQDYDGSKIDTVLSQGNLTSFEHNVYLDNTLSILKHNKLRFGVRATSYNVDSYNKTVAVPRILASVKVPNVCNIKAYWGQAYQFVHFLRTPELLLSSDSWMPATKKTPAQSSELFSVGASRLVKKIGVEFTLEAYTKTMDNLIDYSEHDDSYFASYTLDWQSELAKGGHGTSKGVEFMAHKKEGKYNGWISYTLSRSSRQFDEVNNGKEYLYSFDTKHNFAIVGNYNFSKNVVFSASWVFYSGRAFTTETHKYEIEYIDVFNPDEVITKEEILSVNKNNVRMEPYHRLDLSLQYTKNKNNRDRVWTFGLYNAYNRVNAYGYEVWPDNEIGSDGFPTTKTVQKINKFGLFPVIPSVSFAMEL